MRIFAEAMEHRSFAATARALDDDPSRISRVILSLEAELGLKLFARTTRSQVPTEGGTLLYEEVKPILEAIQLAEERVRDVERKPRGVITMSAPVSFTLSNVMSKLLAFLETFPAISLNLRLHDGVPDFERDPLDLAITLGLPPNSEGLATPLAQMQTHVCASPEYLARKGPLKHPSELNQHNCLLLDMPGFGGKWVFRPRSGTADVAVKVEGSLVTSNALALKQGALAHLGVTLQARWMVENELQAGSLVDVFPTYKATASNFADPAMWLIRAPRAYTPKKVDLVIDFLKDQFR